jgi:hypothetical protein
MTEHNMDIRAQPFLLTVGLFYRMLSALELSIAWTATWKDLHHDWRIFLFFFCFMVVVLGFELRVSHLLRFEVSFA